MGADLGLMDGWVEGLRRHRAHLTATVRELHSQIWEGLDRVPALL